MRTAWRRAVGHSVGRKATARMISRCQPSTDADGSVPEVTPEPSPALLTDLYQLTMTAALVADGRADVPATFSLFVRSLPANRGFLVAAGLDDALRYLKALRFTD